MLTLNIVCIGRLKEEYLKAGLSEYLKRISAFAKINVIELEEYKVSKEPSEAEILKCIEQEGNSILQKARGFIISLCIEGKELKSEQLAVKMSEIALDGDSTISFIIGGSYGLSDTVKQKANFALSMSKMTFPHQLARIMLVEQIYRAFQINSNGKYHK